MEELGDARLRCGQLKKYVEDAVKLIEKSGQRDHFYEVAGHLLYGIPDTLLKLDKALNASVMAVAKWDYEEIKDELLPEKVDQLEAALDDIRVRRVQRRTEQGTQASESPMKINDAVEQLNRLATTIESSGKVDVNEVSKVIAAFEKSPQEVSPDKAAATIRGLANSLQTKTASGRPGPIKIASMLRELVASAVVVQAADGDVDALPQEAKPFNINQSFEAIFEHAKVANRKASSGSYKIALQELSWAVFEISAILNGLGLPMSADVSDRLGKILMRAKASLTHDTMESLKEASSVASEDKESRFEEGKPADPTEEMSEDDANKWKVEHLKNKDNFKEAFDKSAMDGAKFEKVVLPRMKNKHKPEEIYAVLEELLGEDKITSAEFRWLEADAEDYEATIAKMKSDKTKREEGKPILEKIKAKFNKYKGLDMEIRHEEDGAIMLEISEKDTDPSDNVTCLITIEGDGKASIQVIVGRHSTSIDGLKVDPNYLADQAEKMLNREAKGTLRTASWKV